jgi:hypothetical protein
LFNFIFDKGVVPVSWSVGVITHIFKNKGNSKDPKNNKSTSTDCLLFLEKRFNIFHNCLGTDLAELRMLQVILS